MLYFMPLTTLPKLNYVSLCFMSALIVSQHVMCVTSFHNKAVNPHGSFFLLGI